MVLSLNRRTVYAWLLLALAAVLAAGGIRLTRGKRLMSDQLPWDAVSVTTPAVTTPAQTKTEDTESSTKIDSGLIKESESVQESELPSESATLSESASLSESELLTEMPSVMETSVTQTSYAAESSEETESPNAYASSVEVVSEYEESSGGRLIRIAGIVCLLAGCGIAAAVMKSMRQDRAVLGPDGAAVLTALSLIFKFYAWEYVIGLALSLFILLISFREIIGWLECRCSKTWLLVIRAAYALTRLVYGRDIDHLSLQLDRFQAGSPVEAEDGLYAGMEKKLQQIQEEHAQAIKDAVASERFKVDLITNVSHDLRTPLTAIIGYGELLQSEDLSEKGTESLERLNRKAGYMKDLVDHLFELTKISSGSIDPVMKEIDLVRLLEQTIGLMQNELDLAGLTVKRHYISDQLPVVTDGGRMHQVFANLLENACKYALKGSRIYIYADKTDEFLRIRVVNTASYEMNFAPEEIVQRFVRGDKERSTQGSGLGLAIAKTYTESVGGRFDVEIDGDQFNAIVYLPLTQNE